jgi:hypothetical protein
MRAVEVNASFRRQGEAMRDAAPAPVGESRALIALTPAAAACESTESYRQPAFLAHLIATRDHSPQTRERRRAEPGEALAAYRAAAGLAKRLRPIAPQPR